MLGWSAGGPHAAACAFALGSRVTATALVASAIPGDWHGMTHEINRMDRILMRLSDKRPKRRLSFSAQWATARRAPAAFRRLSAVSLDRPSRQVLAAGPAHQFSYPIAEGLRVAAGVLDDYGILPASWGFDLAAIECPVTVWPGDSDRLVPTAWGGRLAAAIPDSESTLLAGQCHFVPTSIYEEIFPALFSHSARA